MLELVQELENSMFPEMATRDAVLLVIVIPSGLLLIDFELHKLVLP